jgi:hypothetical protein
MRVALPAAEDASSEDRLEDDGQEQRHHSVALRKGRHDTRSSKVDSACTTIRVQPFGVLTVLQVSTAVSPDKPRNYLDNCRYMENARTRFLTSKLRAGSLCTTNC